MEFFQLQKCSPTKFCEYLKIRPFLFFNKIRFYKVRVTHENYFRTFPSNSSSDWPPLLANCVAHCKAEGARSSGPCASQKAGLLFVSRAAKLVCYFLSPQKNGLWLPVHINLAIDTRWWCWSAMWPQLSINIPTQRLSQGSYWLQQEKKRYKES